MGRPLLHGRARSFSRGKLFGLVILPVASGDDGGGAGWMVEVVDFEVNQVK